MNSIYVRKTFDVHGRDARQIAERIDNLRDAVRTRGGRIVDIEWRSEPQGHQASVVYRMPLRATTLAAEPSPGLPSV